MYTISWLLCKYFWLFVLSVAYLLVFHVCFMMFCWTYWKSIFTPSLSPCKKVEHAVQYVNWTNCSFVFLPYIVREIGSWLQTWDVCCMFVAAVPAVILRQTKVRDGGKARCSKTNPGWDCKEAAHFHSSTVRRWGSFSSNFLFIVFMSVYNIPSGFIKETLVD